MALSLLVKFNNQKKSWREINDICKKHFFENVGFFPIDENLNPDYNLLGISINSNADKKIVTKLVLDIEKNGGSIKELYNGTEFNSNNVHDYFE